VRPAPAGRRPVSNGKENMDVSGFRRPVRGLRAAPRLLGTCSLALVVAGVGASSAAAKNHAGGPATCSGTPTSPGVLSGTYSSNVTIEGTCLANAGPAVIEGNLTLAPGSGLNAAFHEGNVTVQGNVSVGRGAMMYLGCIPRSFACFDDPTPHTPTLSSASTVEGNLSETQALGVVVHNSTIGGNVHETGGGGGTTCENRPPTFPFGVFSDYEDSTIGGSISVIGLDSCWLGLARDSIGRNVEILQNQLADPDAIEIIANQIGNNLVCQQNSMVWDSFELSEEEGVIFPREPQPNEARHRVGQCVLSSPLSKGGPLGPGPF
jgi:hypothetical protein